MIFCSFYDNPEVSRLLFEGREWSVSVEGGKRQAVNPDLSGHRAPNQQTCDASGGFSKLTN